MPVKLPESLEEVADLIDDGRQRLSVLVYRQCLKVINQKMDENRSEAERLMRILNKLSQG